MYELMQKWKHIDLGQVFTPMHMSRFAAKLLDVNSQDVVLDATAGSGALLIAALERGASKVLGIEYDASVFDVLQRNLAGTGASFEILNASAADAEAADWIREHAPTKAILNPPYEKKYGSLDIFINTMQSLPDGACVAVFYPTSQLEKMTKKQVEWFRANCNVTHKITLPTNLFSPFVSVQTALYLINKGEPQGDIFFCTIEDDGLTRKKGKYREDTKGTWQNELEPYWFKVITEQTGDDSCHVQPGDKGYNYQKPAELPTEDDFRKTINDYNAWKIKNILGFQGANVSGEHSADLMYMALAGVVGWENVLSVLHNQT